ncbi:glycoside hydrolase family 28 protein [Segetibacter sp. 3557_3]|uniref:glycoside hydrolase family 28 protein n=1 Tax=Segetibacter sp. 3557_3 TaxID=2547429 RepID=UPI001058D47C|nr:glycoside hydrolase family 28 protein [Segetibacter sp. 3557_3]TDH21663.1 glycoside hydrolase family 28 protein [Segetibacter sp. 3557_3]
MKHKVCLKRFFDKSTKQVKVGLTVLLLSFVVAPSQAQQARVVWKTNAEPLGEMAKIRTQIRPPKFASREFPITDYGAVEGGKTLNTAAFSKAIAACNKRGGGRVVVPVGSWLTGAIHLMSNVNLHLADSAKIVFSPDPKDYPIVFTRWEGMELMNYSALIYAYGQENIAITGNGTLDGGADRTTWWSWNAGRPSKQVKARTLLHEYNHHKKDARTRIFGDSSYLRPNFIQPYNCKNILISGVKMINSPMWNVNPVLCENVTIDRVTIIAHGPNTDGVDPESCKNVLISNCYFDTGDDCIAIKSGRDEDGRTIGRPAENHIIENCIMKDGHGGVVIGSEISGGARNIFAINCSMDSPNLDRILRLKTSSSRGGVIENVFMKDVKVGTYRDAAVTCNMFYEQPGNFMPTIRNIWVENLDVEKGGDFGLFVKAYKASPVQHLKMVNCNIRGVKTPMQTDYITNAEFKSVVINGKLARAPESVK